MQTLPNDPVSPVVSPDGKIYSGLTVREHFAALIMAGFVANPHSGSNISDAEGAVHAADALIEALNKKEATNA